MMRTRLLTRPNGPIFGRKYDTNVLKMLIWGTARVTSGISAMRPILASSRRRSRMRFKIVSETAADLIVTAGAANFASVRLRETPLPKPFEELYPDPSVSKQLWRDEHWPNPSSAAGSSNFRPERVL